MLRLQQKAAILPPMERLRKARLVESGGGTAVRRSPGKKSPQPSEFQEQSPQPDTQNQVRPRPPVASKADVPGAHHVGNGPMNDRDKTYLMLNIIFAFSVLLIYVELFIVELS